MPDWKHYKRKHSLKKVFYWLIGAIAGDLYLFWIIDKSLDILAYGN